jgi:hypothetical protein
VDVEEREAVGHNLVLVVVDYNWAVEEQNLVAVGQNLIVVEHNSVVVLLVVLVAGHN